jgi:hypothetical protein
MQAFTYTFLDQVYNAFADHHTEGGYNRYRITIEGGSLAIAPSGILGAGGLTMWVQSNKPGETIYPHDLIQSLGDVLENGRIY